MDEATSQKALHSLVTSIEASLHLLAEPQDSEAQAPAKPSLPLAELAAFAEQIRATAGASREPMERAILEGGYYALEQLAAQLEMFDPKPETKAISDCLDAFASVYEPPHDQLSPTPDSLSDYVFRSLTQT